ILERWRREGTALNSGATRSSLQQLQRTLSVSLPDDIRRFYEAADGMRDCGYDRYFLSFWPIEKIVSEHAAERERIGAAPREIAFADFLYESYRYSFRPSDDGEVRIDHDAGGSDEEPSLEAFF